MRFVLPLILTIGTEQTDVRTIVTDLITLEPLQSFKSLKFVVRVAFSPDGRYFATASYDKTIVIYQAVSPATTAPVNSQTSNGAPEYAHGDGDDEMDGIELDSNDHPDIACDPTLRYEEIHRVKVDSNPEAILFHPQSTWLMYTLRNSHLMYYISLPLLHPTRPNLETGSSGPSGPEPTSELPGTWDTRTKSFNPHPHDTHVSFSVLNMSLHPSGKVIACQTGDHRGGSGERVLLYGVEPDEVRRLSTYLLPRRKCESENVCLCSD